MSLTVYIYCDSKPLAPLALHNWFKLVPGPFGQSNMISATDQPGRKRMYKSERVAKGVFFSESAIHFFLSPYLNKKIFQKTILSLKFEFVVYYYWREIQISSSG